MDISPQVGEVAPDFHMPSTHQEDFHLHAELEKGPILLYFYLGDFAPNCTNYMSRLVEHAGDFEELGVRLVAVNPNAMDSHLKWADRLGSSYEYISDKNQEISKAYGAIVKNSPITRGFTNREFFLVDRDKKIRFAWKAHFPRDMLDTNLVVEAVQKMREEDRCP